jgi:hypothetical protein
MFLSLVLFLNYHFFWPGDTNIGHIVHLHVCARLSTDTITTGVQQLVGHLHSALSLLGNHCQLESHSQHLYLCESTEGNESGGDSVVAWQIDQTTNEYGICHRPDETIINHHSIYSIFSNNIFYTLHFHVCLHAFNAIESSTLIYSFSLRISIE